MADFVDFGRAAADYARFRQGFPPDFLGRLSPLGVGHPGQRVVDIGTGTGLFARALAARGCSVIGVDPSAAMLAEARQIASPPVQYVQGGAEHTSLPAASCDVVAAATCWHWFDRPAAAAEARRLLAPGGALLIAHLDWLCRPGNVVDVTQRMIDTHSPVLRAGRAAGGTFLYPAWTGDLIAAGFGSWECVAYTTPMIYTHESWRGRIRASARVGPVMDPITLARFEAALDDALRHDFPASDLAVDHKVFALVCRQEAV